MAIMTVCISFSSCFTGVEGTKKITLSRDDRKAIRPSEEELFFSGINPIPLEKWEKGHPFIAADNKVSMIFDQQGMNPDSDASNLGGETFLYDGYFSRITPDGSKNAVILFRRTDTVYAYDSGKPAEEAPLSILSDQIPMMIDATMVSSARELLKGKLLWTRSPLWYNDQGERIPGKKYVAVTVSDVSAGNISFPLKVKFRDESGKSAYMFMNFGNSGSESRSFPNLFSLSDIRKRYQEIHPEVWELICDGKVRAGMTKEECRLSLGNPAEVSSGHDYSQTLDLWHYSDGSVLWFEDGILSRFRR